MTDGWCAAVNEPPAGHNPNLPVSQPRTDASEPSDIAAGGSANGVEVGVLIAPKPQRGSTPISSPDCLRRCKNGPGGGLERDAALPGCRVGASRTR